MHNKMYSIRQQINVWRILLLFTLSLSSNTIFFTITNVQCTDIHSPAVSTQTFHPNNERFHSTNSEEVNIKKPFVYVRFLINIDLFYFFLSVIFLFYLTLFIVDGK